MTEADLLIESARLIHNQFPLIETISMQGFNPAPFTPVWGDLSDRQRAPYLKLAEQILALKMSA